jgi:hypothetical protein
MCAQKFHSSKIPSMTPTRQPEPPTEADLESLVGKQGLENEALWVLALARVAVTILSFRRVAGWLGRFGHETRDAPTPRLEQALAVAWAVQTTARKVPWRCECLEQALAAKWMLRKRKLPSTLYFGTFFNGHALEAHAWVRCGQQIVTGARGHQQFTVTAVYGDSAGDAP